ncbi:hypothetical protein [Ileibacterium valens]|uniref:hypothetical protein n=1 Tax=Ileibacterium valens TaxID=1862668 RepID=UPI0027312DCE|nr:hypothetical protein [Ileibacterium valens]
MTRSNSQKSPKDYRDLFNRTIDQIGEDPDRSLIQGEAFICDRKIGLSLNVRLIASVSSASIRQQTQTYCKNHHIEFSASAFCQSRQKLDHSLIKEAALGFTKQVTSVSSLYTGEYK